MKSKTIMLIAIVVTFIFMFTGCAEKEAEVKEEVKEVESTFPEKALSAICPWSAGGGTDTILRGLTKSAEAEFGQTITVTNQTGGGGAIGHSAIMTAPNDGYTVGMITFELNSLPPQGLVDFTYEDFEPLMRVNLDAAAITVPADAPYDSIEDFVAYAKENPGEIKVGNSGVGAGWHIAGGLFANAAGIELTHVPFDGAAPAITALVGGHIDAVSVSAAEVQGQVEAGDLKILGIMSEEQLDLFPGVKTMKEQGIDVAFGTWRGLAVPVGTPQDVKDKLVAGFKAALDSSEFVEYANNAGLMLAYQDAEEFEKFLAVNAEDVKNVMIDLGLSE